MATFQDKIKKTSQLAAIKLTNEEQDIYSKEIESILKLLNSFQEVDTTDVEPLKSVHESNTVLRQDISADPDSENKVMPSAINSKYGYFVTPKFVD
jgi:aspartyl-tRNA(Asn)/glutamyl-tRNA(Gln) amidotransferase subunit C